MFADGDEYGAVIFLGPAQEEFIVMIKLIDVHFFYVTKSFPVDYSIQSCKLISFQTNIGMKSK